MMSNPNFVYLESVEIEVTSEQTAQPNSFEDDLRELEEVVTALENGQVPLEDSIRLLQRGMSLAEQCDATLERAEAALEQLVATPDGELITQRLDFEDEDDE